MEKRFELNTEEAEKQTAVIERMTAGEIAALTAVELLPLWYSLCYAQPEIDAEDEKTWGEFRDFIAAVYAKYEEGIFSVYQIETQPDEIREPAHHGLPCETLDEFCEHCKENFLNPLDCSSAYDLDGGHISICDTCRKEDFQSCREPRCCAVYPNDANGCPICGSGGVCTRRR